MGGMFKTLCTFSKYHHIIEERIQQSKYDDTIYTHSSSYFGSVLRWKPQKIVDILYQDGVLMAYN